MAAWVLGLLLVLPFGSAFTPFNSIATRDSGENPHLWGWKDAIPSRVLNWQPCYNKTLQCARLDVPMNWNVPTETSRVILGVARLPGKTYNSSLPPVFINPGGPGVSGLDMLKSRGRHIQTIVGEDHDIISWDPRGVGVSTPRMDCWGDLRNRYDWVIQDKDVYDEHPGLLYGIYARANAESGACEAAASKTGILEHISTVYHARDLLEILNQTGHKKLRYWGFSYGTVLGGVFAALYPDKVERLVSDGNVDYKAWYSLDVIESLSDTDLILDKFDQSCHKVGREHCALWAAAPQEIAQRRSNILEKLKQRPVLVPAQSRNPGPEIPELITYSILQRLTAFMLYKPLANFKLMAHIYAGLEKGDGLPVYEAFTVGRGGRVGGYEASLLDGSRMVQQLEKKKKEKESNMDTWSTKTPASEPYEIPFEPDVPHAVHCTDAQPLNESPEELLEYAQMLSNVSKWAGAANLPFRSGCTGRKVRSKWQMPGDTIRGKTAFPILFIGNIADNVTPLRSAYSNSKAFPGSVVLVQNSYGHCSVAEPSPCTTRRIRAYFQNGTLPAPGTTCEPEVDIFGLREKLYSRSQDELASATWELSRKQFENGIY